MERAERTGLGVAALGHIIVFGLLSLGFLAAPKPIAPPPPPIDVTFADTVALEAKAPQAIEAPAQSRAPDPGPPEDAPSPAPVAQAAPEVTPPAPAPKAAPPPKPAPKPVPQPKTVAAPEKPDKAKTPPKPAAAPVSKAKNAPTKSTGTDAAAAPKPRPRGSLLGPDFLKGIADTPSKSKSVTPQAAKMSQAAAMSIGAAILHQVQPCADRQVTPGPGAERVRVSINLKINRDGSLAGRPTIVGHDGVDDGNRRYVDRVDDLAISTFVGCSPLRGLPAELYDVPNGWSNFTLRYKLPG